MMIVMKAGATEAEIQSVIERIESVGARAHPSRGEELTVIGAIGDREHVARLGLEGAPGVAQVVPILKPYKLASMQVRAGEPTVIDVDGRRSAVSTSRSSPGRAPSSRATRPSAPRAPSPPPARRCSAAARTSRARRRTPSRVSARRACGCWRRPRPRRASRSSPR
jgi:hypothetical protein